MWIAAQIGALTRGESTWRQLIARIWRAARPRGGVGDGAQAAAERSTAGASTERMKEFGEAHPEAGTMASHRSLQASNGAWAHSSLGASGAGE